MRKAIVWYIILLKDHLLRKANWIMLAAMVGLLVMVAQIQVPSVQNNMVGICSTESESAIITDLSAQQGAFRYRQYVNEQKLYDDVQSGRLECGFILPDRLEERIEAGNTTQCVTYVSSPYSSKGEIARETFFASFLRIYSRQILEQCDRELFVRSNRARMAAMERAEEQFLQSDFFRVEQVSVNAGAQNRRGAACYPVQGLLGIFLLGIMYFANGRRLEPTGRWSGNCLCRGDARLFAVVQTLGAVTVPAIVGTVLLLQLSCARPMGEEVCRMVLFVLVGVPWVVLYAQLARSAESFAAYGLVLMVAEMFLYPVVADVAVYVPAIRILRYLTPLVFIL